MESQHPKQPSVAEAMIPAPIFSYQTVQTESIARLLSLNPANRSLFFGIGTHAFLNQFSKLWPSSRIQAVPYFSIPALASAGLGWGIGAYAIRHPHHETDGTFQRIIIAFMEGVGVIFPFFLGELIEIYCRNLKHLDAESDCRVSEETFWKDFFIAPAILSALYIAWNAVSLVQKYHWLTSENKVRKGLVIGADMLSKIVFYSRIIQTLMLTIDRRPMPLLYEGVAIPTALFVLGGEIFLDRHKQKIDTLMQWIMVANLMVYFIFFLEAECFQQSSDKKGALEWSCILYATSLPLLFLGGVIYSLYYGKPYLEAQEAMPALGSRKRYTAPIERKIADLLRNPQERDSLITAILSDEQSRNNILQKMASVDPHAATGNPVSELPVPQTIEEIMGHAQYKKVARVVMQSLGYEVMEEDAQEDDELRTLRGSVSAHDHAGLLRNPGRPRMDSSEGSRQPLLFQGPSTAYQATDAPGPSHPIQSVQKTARRPGFSRSTSLGSMS